MTEHAHSADERDESTTEQRHTRNDRPLSARIRERPRPAAIWASGVLVLLAVELGWIGSGVLKLGDILVGAVTDGYGWTVSMVGSGGSAGIVTLAAVAVGLYLTGLAIATWTRLALLCRATDRMGYRAEQAIDGALFGAAIAGILAVFVLSGAADAVALVGDWLRTAVGTVADLPSLTARETIPNRGYQTPDGSWSGTFAGLSPAYAWALRVAVVYIYTAAALAWIWVGYLWYRAYYRRVDWTPRDDIVRRLRSHRWGQFGMVITFLFLTMAVFAPSLATTTAQQNLYEPFTHSIQYYDANTGSVQEIAVGSANLQTQSEGYVGANIGPMSYDQYDRFHPAGTLTNGKDLFTFLTYGARVSLVIGLLSISVSAVLATVFALLSAYYRGLVDLVLVVVGDTIMGVPRLLMLILLVVVLKDTWLGELYNGGILLALILAGTGWPFLWRAFRGPTLQIAEEDWVDAAHSYGQSASGIMRLHMVPYLIGYLLIYSSLILGGVILAVAGLSFLGFGITAPTPEWGRAINQGREYVASPSWHISLIPGLMITLVVMGFNAMGDALRDAVDPKSDEGAASAAETDSRGGGV